MDHPFSLNRRLLAEGLGTLLLVATVVGSGIMADALSNDVAISLLGNTIATGAILFVLITIFGPVSGAHFNPAVSFVFYLRGDLAGGMTLRLMLYRDEFLTLDPKACKHSGPLISKIEENLKELSCLDDKSAA